MKKKKYTKQELKLIACKTILDNIDKISHNVCVEFKKRLAVTKE